MALGKCLLALSLRADVQCEDEECDEQLGQAQADEAPIAIVAGAASEDQSDIADEAEHAWCLEYGCLPEQERVHVHERCEKGE